MGYVGRTNTEMDNAFDSRESNTSTCSNIIYGWEQRANYYQKHCHYFLANGRWKIQRIPRGVDTALEPQPF